jgi:hypothetical protein
MVLQETQLNLKGELQMKGKRLFALMASVSLLFGTASFKQAALLQTYKADDAIMQDAPADLAMANEEKLIG